MTNYKVMAQIKMCFYYWQILFHAIITSLSHTTDLAENKRVVLYTAFCNKDFGKLYQHYDSIHGIYVYVKQRLTKPIEIK